MPETHELVIVGAGPAGLCAAAAGRERGWEPVLLERADQAGGLWKRVPGDMRCLSPRGRDVLPDGSTPRGPGDRATAAEVVEALDAFVRAAAFDLRTGVQATALRAGDDLELTTSAGPVGARRLILATGMYDAPRIPDLPGRFDGPLDHSSTVDLDSVEAGEHVLVVGGGNSATDLVPRLLARKAKVTLSATRPPRMPRQPPPFPLKQLLWRASALPVKYLPPSMRCGSSLDPVDPVLVDARRRCRIRAVGPAIALEPTGVVCEDVGLEPCDRVVFCTGFRRDLAWTGLRLADDGMPEHDEGLSTEISGVGFLGLPCLRTRRSQFLRGLWGDARAVVGRL